MTPIEELMPKKKDLNNAQLSLSTFKYYEGCNDTIDKVLSALKDKVWMNPTEENMARILFEENQKEMYGKGAVSWDKALDYEKQGDKTCERWRKKAKAILDMLEKGTK